MTLGCSPDELEAAKVYNEMAAKYGWPLNLIEPG
jgi:hypothetical protein